MARNLIDDTYYKSGGGKIPVKWTSPEVMTEAARFKNEQKGRELRGTGRHVVVEENCMNDFVN